MKSSQTLAFSTPRDRILAAATRLFLEGGIQAVSIDRIIAEADVALMTLYRRFGGKDELVAAALQHWSDQRLRWLTNRLDQCGDDPRARFMALWDAIGESLDAEGLRSSFAVSAAAELRSKPHHPAHAAVAAHRMAMRQFLENLAELLGATDPAALAAQLQIVVEGVEAGGPADAASARALANASLAANSHLSQDP